MYLSIITINYNHVDGLRKTIDSVCSQSYQNFEWIIIDGGSIDGSRELIEKTAKTCFDICFWCSEPDNGIYNAMNKGIRQSKGDYLLFLNSGDYLYNNHVLEQVLPLLNGKDMYIGDVQNDKDGLLEVDEFPRDLTTQVILDQLVFKLIPHQASFIKRELFEKYGLYREDLRIASDWYFFYNVLVWHGASIQTIPQVIAVFDMTGISSVDKCRISERITSQDDIPCQQRLFTFYRDNAELIEAINGTWIGRLLVRIYFFFYRKLYY